MSYPPVLGGGGGGGGHGSSDGSLWITGFSIVLFRNPKMFNVLLKILKLSKTEKPNHNTTYTTPIVINARKRFMVPSPYKS
jgi:hypothetical protein